MEDPPPRPQKGRDPRLSHVVVCSARTSYSLKENQRRLLQYLRSHPESKVSDVAYTTTARRMHDVFRSSYIVGTTQDLARLITKDLDDPSTAKSKPVGTRSSVVFAFTGQGSLYPGMGKELFETCSGFRKSILSFQKICDSQGLPLVADLISDSNTDLKAKTTIQLQLALVFLELALAELWKTWGVQPDLVIGHSLGEYAALCVSGVLSVSDTLYLVGRRASIMNERCMAGSHAMLAISASMEVIEDALTTQGLSSCAISCKNAPDLSVVSGTHEDIENLQQSFQASQTKAKLLEVPYAFHSSQIDPILDELYDSAKGVNFAKPLVPVASTLTSNIVDNVGTFSPEYITRQAREPVNFVGALQACKIQGSINEQTLWMEIGPGPVCLGMVRSSFNAQSARLLPTIKPGEDNWKTISTSAAMAYMSKIPMAWPEYHREYVNCLTLLELPSYAFDLKEYWSSYQKDLIAPATNNQTASAPARTSEKKRLPTTCLQYVEKESLDGDTISATFSSHTSEPKLFDAIQGHLVDGTAICPASVFCDIAFTAARYIYSQVRSGGQVPEMSISSLDIIHPLVTSVQDPQQLIEVDAGMSSKTSDTVQVSFKSKAESSSYELGACEILFGKNDDCKNTFARTLHLVRRRIDDLTKSANAGLCHRLQRPIVYKLFASLVEYSDKYQGLEEVFMDNEYGDAAATVKLRPRRDTGNFTQSPYWIDAIIHLAGFHLNGNVNHGDETAFISTGFDALHIFEELSEEKVYSTYVSVQPTEKKDIFSGDVYVFEGDTLVALCSAIHFHKMTRKVLRVIFGQSNLVTRPKKVQSVKAARNDKSLPQSKVRSEKTQSPITPNSSSSDFESSTGSTSPPSSIDDDGEPDKAVTLLRIVSSESGYDIADMEPTTSFADMGVDSLMSIAIISTAQKQMGLELPAGFFNDFPLVSDVRKEFGRTPRPTNEENLMAVGALLEANHTSQSDGSMSPVDEDSRTVHEEGDLTMLSMQSRPVYSPPPEKDDKADMIHPVDTTLPATTHGSLQEPSGKPFSHAVLIRGRASSKEIPLFLATDGAGSATAYIHLPPLSTGNRIYALESPFLHVPQQYTCSVEEVCGMYCAAIRKIQPQGPYMIGGWSAGAVYAYEVTRQLLGQNERVLGLILIDMRVPRPMPDALEPTIDLIESAGLFTGIDRSGQSQAPASQKLKHHLVNTVKALTGYQPIALDPVRRPNHCFVIWAKKGLSESEKGDPFGIGDAKSSSAQSALETPSGNIMEDPETGMKSWFYAKRSAFGPNGWDKLVGDIECSVVEGADHFSMVVPPKARILGQLLDSSVKKCLASKT